MYKKAAIYKKKRVVKEPSKTKKQHYKMAPVKGEKNGDKRVILLRKSVRWWGGEDMNQVLFIITVNFTR